MLKKQTQKGFSLIELLVAVAIIAILTAFLVPSLYHYFDETREKKDIEKFNTVSVAFKRSLGYPSVQKEAESLDEGEVYQVIFYIDEDGYIDFQQGQLIGIEKEFAQTQLWLNTYQMIGVNYQTDYKEHEGKYLIYTLVPKRHNTTAQCTYEIKDSIS